ncbi:MAG: hypothetical protein GX971_10230 [Firmicutes bacterium]|nr:hypothetical protein [Bacillota bacterium]
MLRYNHRILERKWRIIYREHHNSLENPKRACAFLIPKEQVNLENARLLVLTDVFAASFWKDNYRVILMDGNYSCRGDLERLGVFATTVSPQDNVHFDFAVVSRDFRQHLQHQSEAEVFSCGRFLQGMGVEELVPDFGGDALRVYFLFMGPPERDYTFDWQALVGAYRFVEKVWRLGQEFNGETPPEQGTMERLSDLTNVVRNRLLSKNPHTALAAIMGFLKDKKSLNIWELTALVDILRPFTPFLSAELADLVATIKDDNGRECDQTDS